MEKSLMKFVLILVLATPAFCMDTHPHPYHGLKELDLLNPFCLPHCSYICMATSGRIETCNKLMLPGNDTLTTIPLMETCPSTMSSIDECFLKCGCQCTRCTVCMARSLTLDSTYEECQLSANKFECIMGKKAAALKDCQ